MELTPRACPIVFIKITKKMTKITKKDKQCIISKKITNKL